MRHQMHMFDGLFLIDGMFSGSLRYVDPSTDLYGDRKYEYAQQFYGETRCLHVFSSRSVQR